MPIQEYSLYNILLLIFYIVVPILIIVVPILIIYRLSLRIRASTMPHQREVQRLLKEAVDSLKENNRLLAQLISSKAPDQKQ